MAWRLRRRDAAADPKETPDQQGHGLLLPLIRGSHATHDPRRASELRREETEDHVSAGGLADRISERACEGLRGAEVELVVRDDD